MEETYVLYSEEYYFDFNAMSSVLLKHVYTVSYDKEAVEDLYTVLDDELSSKVNKIEFDQNSPVKMMLTTYSLRVIPLEGHLSIDEATKMVKNDDYTWGKVNTPKM